MLAGALGLLFALVSFIVSSVVGSIDWRAREKLLLWNADRADMPVTPLTKIAVT